MINKGVIAYHHEASLCFKHAGAFGLVPVVEVDHVETDSLRYCKEERQQPNSRDLYDCEQRDAHSLNSAPGGHRPVPVDGRRKGWIKQYVRKIMLLEQGLL